MHTHDDIWYFVVRGAYMLIDSPLPTSNIVYMLVTHIAINSKRFMTHLTSTRTFHGGTLRV